MTEVMRFFFVVLYVIHNLYYEYLFRTAFFLFYSFETAAQSLTFCILQFWNIHPLSYILYPVRVWWKLLEM